MNPRKKVMNKLVFLVLAFCITLSPYACGKTDRPENDVDTISDDDYEIYTVVINKIKQEREKEVWIANKTKYDQDNSEKEFYNRFDWVEEKLKVKIDGRIKDDFYNKNLKHYIFANKFSAIKGIRVVSVQELDAMLADKENPWGMGEKSSGYAGYAYLSRIGFNNTKTKALLYYESAYHFLDGAGMCVLLEKENNKWVIKYELMLWIS